MLDRDMNISDETKNENSETSPENEIVNSILKGFRQVYEKSILEYAKEYLNTGEEFLICCIGARAQFIKATPADIKEISKFINDLNKKEANEKVLLTTREAVLLGAAYEYGLVVKKNSSTAIGWYKTGSKRVNPEVTELISNRDRGHSLANACSLLPYKESLRIAREASKSGSEFAYAHLGCLLTSSHNPAAKIEGIEILKKAPSIGFANGRLGFALTDKEEKKRYFGIAASQGDYPALNELRNYYQYDSSLYNLLRYEYSLRAGNYFNEENPDLFSEKDIAESKEDFNKLFVEAPDLFQELTNYTPLVYVQALLAPEDFSKCIYMKSIYLSRYYVVLKAVLPKDLGALILPYLCLSDYLERGREASYFSEYLNFWNANPEASKDDITKFVATGKERLESRYRFYESPAILSRRKSNSDILKVDVGVKQAIRRLSL